MYKHGMNWIVKMYEIMEPHFMKREMEKHDKNKIENLFARENEYPSFLSKLSNWYYSKSTITHSLT